MVPTVKAGRYSFVTLVPIANRPDDPKLTGEPAIVTLGLPAKIVVPATEDAVGYGVEIWAPTVIDGGEDPGGKERIPIADPGIVIPG